MATLVVSDLHLGGAFAADVLRRTPARERLLGALRGCDRLILLGDALELRELPLARVLELTQPFFDAIGEAFDGQVVIVPGNHDHALAGPMLERRRLKDSPPPLGLAEEAKPGRNGPLAAIARRMPRCEVVLSYPGTWVRDDVYATHGHYLDCFMRVPRAEVLALRMIARVVDGLPGGGRHPDEYELVLAPLYALTYQLAQATAPGRAAFGTDFSARVWRQLNSRRPTMRSRALGAVAIPLAVAGLNRARLGPFTRDLSGRSLLHAGIEAMAEVVRRLEIDAEWVLYGHTHRTGPLPGDPAWTAPGGARLVNTGSWIFEPGLLAHAGPSNPYWPGGAVVVRDSGPPELLRLLGDVGREELQAP